MFKNTRRMKLFIGAVLVFFCLVYYISSKARLVERVLDSDWDPYGDPPVGIEDESYLIVAYCVVLIDLKIGNNVEDISSFLSETEKSWKFEPDFIRAHRVSETIDKVLNPD